MSALQAARRDARLVREPKTPKIQKKVASPLSKLRHLYAGKTRNDSGCLIRNTPLVLILIFTLITLGAKAVD